MTGITVIILQKNEALHINRSLEMLKPRKRGNASRRASLSRG